MRATPNVTFAMKTRSSGRLSDGAPTETPAVDDSALHSARCIKIRPAGITIPPRFPLDSEIFSPLRSGRKTPGGSVIPSTDNINLEVSNAREEMPRLTLDDILGDREPTPPTPVYLAPPKPTAGRSGYTRTTESVQSFLHMRFSTEDPENTFADQFSPTGTPEALQWQRRAMQFRAQRRVGVAPDMGE